jgi:hypothetical protein
LRGEGEAGTDSHKVGKILARGFFGWPLRARQRDFATIITKSDEPRAIA